MFEFGKMRRRKIKQYKARQGTARGLRAVKEMGRGQDEAKVKRGEME